MHISDNIGICFQSENIWWVLMLQRKILEQFGSSVKALPRTTPLQISQHGRFAAVLINVRLRISWLEVGKLGYGGWSEARWGEAGQGRQADRDSGASLSPGPGTPAPPSLGDTTCPYLPGQGRLSSDQGNGRVMWTPSRATNQTVLV